MESGVHLRWQPGPDVGFPSGGFDVFRREHVEHASDSFVGFNELTQSTLSGLGWELLNTEMPINLPITHPDWPGKHPHSPHDLKEALARLPAVIEATVRTRYKAGFEADLETILETLVATNPQQDARVSETGVSESKVRTTRSSPLLETRLLSLLSLLSLDPNMARILGLYYVDGTADSGVTYDYLLVGHYENSRVPWRSIDFDDVATGTAGPSLVARGRGAITTPRPMTVVDSTWAGTAERALQFAYDGRADSVWVSIDASCKSLEFRLDVSGSPTEATIEAFAGNIKVADATVVTGESTVLIEAPSKINMVLVTITSAFDLFEITIRSETGTMGDVAYLVYDVAMEESPGVPTRELNSATAFQLPTRVSGAQVEPESCAVALAVELDTSSTALSANAPLLYRFRRTNLDDDTSTDLNLDRPTLIPTTAEARMPRPKSISGVVHYLDPRIPAGSYAYQVQGIDLFGRLSDWSAEKNTDVAPAYGPPPPAALTAKYLDALDTQLTAEEKSRVEASGNGLQLSWTWTGMQRVQAPMMEASGAEFHIYDIAGVPNTLRGAILSANDLGDRSELKTNVHFDGATDTLAGLSLRCGLSFFAIESHTRGNNITVTVRHLANPTERPDAGDCSIVIPRGHAAWTNLHAATNWERQIHAEPIGKIAVVKGKLSGVSVTATTRASVTINARLVNEASLVPGVLIVDGVVYPVAEHTPGSAAVLTIELPVLHDGSISPAPTSGQSARYLPGKRYSVYLGDYELTALDGESVTYATIGASAFCSDVEGAVGRPAAVTAFHREPPAAPVIESVDDDEWLVAEPADYYGVAKHTISWPAVTGAAGYLVYRATGASLFENDREQRRTRADDYAGDPFADDAGYDDWKATNYPDVDMFADIDSASASDVSTVLTAWRAWAARFYPMLSPAQVQMLASKACNRDAFRRVNTDPVEATWYEDRFAGRGDGFHVWRIRAVNASGVPGDCSTALEPVRIFDVTPPATPNLTSVRGSVGGVVLSWGAVADDDVVAYAIYRADSVDELSDIRRKDPILTIETDGSVSDLTATDESAVALANYYYCVVAVDHLGNRSSPSRALMGRAIAETPPAPEWVSAAWTDDGVDLIWSMASGDMQALVERRVAGTTAWLSLGTWLDAGVASYVDASASSDEDLEFRVRVKNTAGLQSAPSETIVVGSLE